GAPRAPAAAPPPPPAGAPPTFGTAPAVGPAVSPGTFAEAEKLSQVTLTGPERDMAAASWPKSLAPLLERRVGPRTVALEAEHVPASHWNPVLAPGDAGPRQDRFVRSSGDPGPLPSSDDAIAFAPLTQLSRGAEQRQLGSQRPTRISLDRLRRFGPTPRCAVTLGALPAP